MYKPDKLKIHSNRPRLYTIDFYLNKSIEGRVNGTKNVITRQYWALMFSMLAHGCLDGKDHGGAVRPICGGADVNYLTAFLNYGSGTIPEAFSQYHLATPVANLATSITFGTGTDRNRISLTAVAPETLNETSVVQRLIVGGTNYHFMFARKVITVAANQPINYSFDFFDPWTYNMALTMFGVFMDENISSVVDIGGTVFTARTKGDFTESAARLVISETTETWTPTKTSITNPIELTTYHAALSADNIAYLILTGVIAPATSITVRTIGVVQKLFGTDNVARNCLMLLQPLATPITFEANRTNMVQLRLIAL